MNTPICEFIEKYRQSNPLRLHMPGHKGKGFLGFEDSDITEIPGADSLYSASGIIAESEASAASIFGAHTFYSTEGSSLSIRAMLYLTVLYSKSQGKEPLVLAARNAHKVFLSAVSLLDINVKWLDTSESSYLSFSLDTDLLEREIVREKPTALYLTSPDYLGNICDIAAASDVCNRHGVLLLVDNAHGAYMKFLPESRHPIDLGAHMCADSAHKTLPTLTGAAYLHVSRSAPAILRERARDALALFGSTSPSYLILASLDKVNAYIADGYREKLAEFTKKVECVKDMLTSKGFELVGDEILKITIATKSYGYTGYEIADYMRLSGIECEFADPDFIVFMLTPELFDYDLASFTAAFYELAKKERIDVLPPKAAVHSLAISPREAMMSECENVAVRDSVGRILASPCVACPPAVPVLMCGEVIGKDDVRAFLYYGIDTVTVVKA